MTSPAPLRPVEGFAVGRLARPVAAVTQGALDARAERLWLHTCLLDSAAAPPAYERRGFRRADARAGR
jgi:hypothetical protein